jgi:hypothetical protein
MKKQIKIEQKDSEIDFSKIVKVNFVNINKGLMTIEVELKE